MRLCPQVPVRPAGVGCSTWGLRPWSLGVARALTADSSFPQTPPTFVQTLQCMWRCAMTAVMSPCTSSVLGVKLGCQPCSEGV